MTSAPIATAYAPSAMVASVDRLASDAGLAALRRGGSVVDAAVAASAVLAVTAPHACGMGGDLFAIVVEPGREPVVLEAAGRAGSGADPDRMRAEHGDTMPFRDDIRVVTVPGCVDGWLALLERFGRLPVGDVLADAVGYARDGFPASPTLARRAAEVAGRPGADDIAGIERAGQLVRRPGVARTLEALSDEGRAGFYQGEFGQGLVALGAGEYVPDDLVAPIARWVDPLRLRVWDRDLWVPPPPSQGYLTLSSAWIAEGLPLPDDPSDPRWPHLLVEATRQAGHDRLDVLYEGADGAALLDPERLTARRARIDATRAGSPAAPAAAGGTIFLAVAHVDGSAVALIQSNAAGFGSLLVEPSTGIFLHNRGCGFSLRPGHPAEYRPRRRPPHTLAPLVATNPDGMLHAVAGTMGGDSQPQVLLQLLARVLREGAEPGEAIAAGRWVLGSRRDPTFDVWQEPSAIRVRVEAHAPPAWVDGLRARGHPVEPIDALDDRVGHAHLIVHRGDRLAGASDPRAPGGGVAVR